MDTSVRGHSGPWTHPVVNATGRGHSFGSWTQRAVDTALGRGRSFGSWTQRAVDTLHREHNKPWTQHWVVDTAESFLRANSVPSKKYSLGISDCLSMTVDTPVEVSS